MDRKTFKQRMSGMARIFASLFHTPTEPKDWSGFGYAPANRWELGEWNANRDDRAARRREEREAGKHKRAGFQARIKELVAAGEYAQVVHLRSLHKAIWKGGL